MTQLTTPYLACMTLASLLSGVLNTKERFALSVGAPILLNVCTLIPLLVVDRPYAGRLCCNSRGDVAGILQGALLWWGVRVSGSTSGSAFRC